MAAIRAACKTLGDWRLNGCELYVTLEPCPMCAGAVIAARIKRVYFGAYDRLYGAFGGRLDLNVLTGAGGPEVYGGIMEEECSRVIKGFFEKNRVMVDK
jgi:tRNA(adenine34) deaminase